MDSNNPRVGIVMGSDSDWSLVKKACDTLDSFGVPYETRVISAHRTPDVALDYAKTAEARGIQVVIAAAGGAAHLGGVLAAGTVLPVIGIPVAGGALNGLADAVRRAGGHCGLRQRRAGERRAPCRPDTRHGRRGPAREVPCAQGNAARQGREGQRTDPSGGMKLQVFGSGSQGNALAVSSGGTLLLLDCGFSCKELERRMAACGVDPDAAAGLFFTHDHTDHCKGTATFHHRHPQVPLYANGNTADAISVLTGVDDGWCVFETAETFPVGDFAVTSFSIPHDAADPVGYLFEDGASALFVGTDMGVPTFGVRDALARATCAVLESNHDPTLLACSDRPVSLKQRIAGRCGHLSNQDAADLVREVAPPNLKTLLLAHLSQPCNAPHLALESMREALRDINRTDIALATLDQDEPSEVFEF